MSPKRHARLLALAWVAVCLLGFAALIALGVGGELILLGLMAPGVIALITLRPRTNRKDGRNGSAASTQ